MLIALIYIWIIIIRLKGTTYLNLALTVCLFLDSPTTLGTKNLVMRTYILPLKKNNGGTMKSQKITFLLKQKSLLNKVLQLQMDKLNYRRWYCSDQRALTHHFSHIFNVLNETSLGSKIQTVLGIWPRFISML